MGDNEDTNGTVRERILEAALAILSEDGISELSQVQVARRAGVRQSHLTYYFPKRHDLIEAVTRQVVGAFASGVHQAVMESEGDVVPMLQRLAEAVTQREHMRMFVGAIVEADRDPAVQAVLLRGTEQLQAALADALGGQQALEQARLILTTLWGFGLYACLTGTPPDIDAALLVRLAGQAEEDA